MHAKKSLQHKVKRACGAWVICVINDSGLDAEKMHKEAMEFAFSDN